MDVLHILHADPQGSRLLVHLELARLGLHGAQHAGEGLALEEAVLLVRDEGADERALPAGAG